MFCKNCGNNVEEAAFCSVCGAALESGAPEAANAPASGELTGPGKTMALISMILGIVSLAGGITPAAIAGIILSILSNKKAAELGVSGDKKAKIGMICSLISIAMNVLMIVGLILFYIVYFVIFAAAMSQM